MSIDLSCVNYRVEPIRRTYTWQEAALYALAVGAGEHDLKYLRDQPPPQVLPTFGVLPALDAVMQAGLRSGANLLHLLHTAQRCELVKPFPAHGPLLTQAAVRGIWDARVGAIMIIDTETFVDGELGCRTAWHLLLRGEGGFGGERAPSIARARAARGSDPDFEVEVPTRREQALLYRLTGDLNPIHSDPTVAQLAGFERPIMHGLCTYGIAARVALAQLAGDEPGRFKAFDARFAKVVMPGDTLIVRGYKTQTPGQAAITVTIKEAGDEAIASSLFEYTPD